MPETEALQESTDLLTLSPLAPVQGIVVTDLVKTYKGGKKRALNGLSLSVAPGEAVGLVGPNGAGKTTFLSCLMGFLRYDSGNIEIDGLPPDCLEARRLVGYLPERLTFDRWMTGRDYMHYHHELAGMPESVRKYECEELLRRVELDAAAWGQAVKKYSRGMLQRLGFAQALLSKPKYLLLDEPASGMDPGGVLVVRNLLKELRKEGLTIILNSHQLDQIEKVCDRVIMIEAGAAKPIDTASDSAVDTTFDFCIKWLNGSHDGHRAEDLGALVQRHVIAIKDLYDGQAILTLHSDREAATILRMMVQSGFEVHNLSLLETRLEKLFAKKSS